MINYACTHIAEVWKLYALHTHTYRVKQTTSHEVVLRQKCREAVNADPSYEVVLSKICALAVSMLL